MIDLQCIFFFADDLLTQYAQIASPSPPRDYALADAQKMLTSFGYSQQQTPAYGHQQQSHGGGGYAMQSSGYGKCMGF